VQNYTPITICSILRRLYWGINDKNVWNVIDYSARPVGFVHETECFNNVHTLNWITRGAKSLTTVHLAVHLSVGAIKMLKYCSIPKLSDDSMLLRHFGFERRS
jgi:hypothetical protein